MTEEKFIKKIKDLGGPLEALKAGVSYVELDNRRSKIARDWRLVEEYYRILITKLPKVEKYLK